MEERMNRIVEILKASGADDYEVEVLKETGWEFYFIRHELDQNRAKDITNIKIRVFKKLEEGKFLGNAIGMIPPTATDEEIEKTVKDLVYQANLVKNPYYELNEPSEAQGKEAKTAEVSVEEMAKDFIEAFAAVPETETEFLNSYEIFVSKKEKHFINSRGVDVRMTYPASQLEVVTNAKIPEGKEPTGAHREIEMYNLYWRGTCDRDALVKDVTEVLNTGKDRLIAGNTPHLKKASLILSTHDATEVLDFFVARMNAAMKYQGYSDWEPGKAVSEEIKGDKVTVKVVPELPNSSENFPFDEEGAEVTERYIMKDSVPETFWGGRQFSQYLGLKESSIVYNYEVSGGTKSGDELRQGPYLEVVEFSGFGVDAITGDIAGEIRLAYWNDGEKTVPVSGGSVSGSMLDFVKEMYMSKETRQYDSVVIPAVIRLENATITGIE